MDVDKFRTALLESELCDITMRPQSADDCFQQYHDVLQSLADRFAPVTKITLRRQRLAAWMDAECRQLRRKSRMLERRYRRTQQPSDRQQWVEHERKRHQVYRRKEQLYWSMQLSEHASQPRKLWRSLNALLGKNSTRTSNSRSPSAQQLLDYFVDKVASVRRSTGGSKLHLYCLLQLHVLISLSPAVQRTSRKSLQLHQLSPVRWIRYPRKLSKRSYQNYFLTLQPCAIRRCYKVLYLRVNVTLLWYHV